MANVALAREAGSATSEAAPVLPFGIVGVITKVTGEVMVIHADGSAERMLVGDLLLPGDIIQTADGAAIGFDLIDDPRVSVADGSRLVLDEVIFDPATGDGSIQISAIDGTIAVEGGQIAASNPRLMIVHTPFGNLTTGSSRVTIDVDDGLDIIVIPSSRGDTVNVLFRNDGGLLTLGQPFAFAHIDGVGHIPEAAVLASDSDIMSRVKLALDHLSQTKLSPAGGSDNAFQVEIAAVTDSGSAGVPPSGPISVTLDDSPADRSNVSPVRFANAPEGAGNPDIAEKAPQDDATPADTIAVVAVATEVEDSEPALPVTDVEIIGTGGNNAITGTDANDLISGGGGNDNLRGGAGDDIVNGDSGNDTVRGEAGDDVLAGGTGNDNLIGGDGADRLSGGDGNDTLQIDANDTLIDGGAGTDRVIVQGSDGISLDLGAANIERATGNVGDDTFDGSGLTDRADLRGGGGNDSLTGGLNNDTLRGELGDDLLFGGKGRVHFSAVTATMSLRSMRRPASTSFAIWNSAMPCASRVASFLAIYSSRSRGATRS